MSLNAKYKNRKKSWKIPKGIDYFRHKKYPLRKK